MVAVYLARNAQITHRHMAALAADRRTRALRLAQWREHLGLPGRVRLRLDEKGAIKGFRAPRPEFVPPGWTHSKGTLVPDRRTTTGLTAAADLRAIPSGVTGDRPGDRPWPGGMPDVIMLTGLNPALTPGRVSWSIERPTTGLLGARLYVRWPNGLPAQARAALDLAVWEEIPPAEWRHRISQSGPLTHRDPNRW
ncbi:hypothetical protein [Nocardiopsis synnemataformans]|uniref:hypothetical protein n=1 Tax=Nocardiopsis synnemataformans TaxID=61305 RepID=UPI003EBFF48A